MNAKTCPISGLFNPPGALHCDCGFVLASGSQATREALRARTGGIKSWHGGKIGLLWVISFGAPVVFVGVAFGIMENLFLPILGYWLVLGAPWVIPITWKWLSGKEKR